MESDSYRYNNTSNSELKQKQNSNNLFDGRNVFSTGWL